MVLTYVQAEGKCYDFNPCKASMLTLDTECSGLEVYSNLQKCLYIICMVVSRAVTFFEQVSALLEYSSF